MTTLLTDLGISSPYEAAELEQDLGIRFHDFTPEDADTLNRQTLYLNQYARTRTFTHAARAAGVSIRTARTWQSDNTLGFNHRLEIAVHEYTEEIEVILIEQVRQPKPSPALLAMLLRAHLPEKYGRARRDSAPRNGQCDHDDDPKPETSQEDRESLEDIRRDLQDLKLFAGLTEPPVLSSLPQGESLPRTGYGGQGEGEPPHPQNPTPNTQNPSTSAPSPVLGEGWGEGETPSTQHPAPTLNRRQRRELQRRAKRQKAHRARAPN